MGIIEIKETITMIVIVLLSISVHEFAHCYVTDTLGDDTPRSLGRVTLNPIKHLDPLGTVMIFIMSFSGYGIGWGKPSPFNPDNFKNPRRDRMLTALAGPLSNIAIALIAVGAFQALAIFDINADFLSMVVLINICLAFFNLLPIFPLDGHHVLGYFLPDNARAVLDSPIWGFVFLAIVLIPKLSEVVFGNFFSKVILRIFDNILYAGVVF